LSSERSVARSRASFSESRRFTFGNGRDIACPRTFAKTGGSIQIVRPRASTRRLATIAVNHRAIFARRFPSAVASIGSRCGFANWRVVPVIAKFASRLIWRLNSSLGPWPLSQRRGRFAAATPRNRGLQTRQVNHNIRPSHRPVQPHQRVLEPAPSDRDNESGKLTVHSTESRNRRYSPDICTRDDSSRLPHPIAIELRQLVMPNHSPRARIHRASSVLSIFRSENLG